jgi:hypothetical protein
MSKIGLYCKYIYLYVQVVYSVHLNAKILEKYKKINSDIISSMETHSLLPTFLRVSPAYVGLPIIPRNNPMKSLIPFRLLWKDFFLYFWCSSLLKY